MRNPTYNPIPVEWDTYVTQTQHPIALEVIPACIYDTQIFYANDTVSMLFFSQGMNMMHCKSSTNMYLAGQLPNPQAFLIAQIQIDGAISNLRYGACVLHIGAKHYGYNPLWTYGLKQKGLKLKPALLIPPMMNFQFVITWDEPQPLGRGLTGYEKYEHPIQVVMSGQLARPVQ